MILMDTGENKYDILINLCLPKISEETEIN